MWRVNPDVLQKDHYYAQISNYLEFPQPVPFKKDNFYFEKALEKSDGTTNKGAFGHSVRIISDDEYEQILNMGFVESISQNHKIDHDALALLDHEQDNIERRMVEQVTKRPFREAAFSTSVKKAYANTCAMTGLKIPYTSFIYEAHAAHIKPVLDNGPDSVRNGIALSRTIHWMFDNGLISIDKDFSILKAKKKIPSKILKLLNESNKLILPIDITRRPSELFLSYHREHIFRE